MRRRPEARLATCAAIVGLALLGSPTRSNAQTTGTVRLAVTLKLHDLGGLEKLVAAQSDPRSPQYAHFLTPAAFGATYAPTQDEYGATVAALRSRGFSIVRTMRDRSLIDVSASATTIAKTFGSTPHASWMPAIDPAALPYVASVSGSESIAFAPRTHGLSASPTTASADHYLGPDGGYAPAALEIAHDYPILHGFDGAGMTVADVIDSVPDSSFAQFVNALGISPVPAAPTVIPLNGASQTDPTQADFDAEWILGTAPGATLDIYEIPNLSNVNIVDGLDRVVSDDLADVIAISFAGCEPNPTFTDALIPIFAHASALGMTIEAPVFNGVNACGFANQEVPQTPADISDVLAVGASSTITSTTHTIAAETGLGISGGGVSIVVPVPAEQKHIPGVNPAGRNVPDFVIAGEIDGAGPAYSVYGYWVGGAPNVNAPAAGGMLAEIAQYSGHRLGAFGRTMYRAFEAFGYGGAFEDISLGCNGVIDAVNVCAVPGYDLTTGIGSVDATLLANLTKPSAMNGANR